MDKGENHKDESKRVTLEGFAASVELPEGHQLIIGELPPGTVVEVATWQGIGRPDESTNRFLLTADGPGLQPRRREPSKATAPDPTPEPTPEPEVQQAPQPAVEPVAEVPVEAIPQSVVEQEPEPILENVAELASEFIAAPSIEEKAATFTRKPMDDFLGVRLPEKEEAAEIQVEKGGRWKNFGRAIFTAAASLVIVVVLLNMIGISMTVPSVAGNSTFGNLTHSLVLYKRGNNLDNNAPTVVISQKSGKKEILLGNATIFSSSQLEISTTRGLLLEDANSVVGHSIIAIPFVGWILSPIFR